MISRKSLVPVAEQLVCILIAYTITACVPMVAEPIPTGRPTLTSTAAATATPATELIATGRLILTPTPATTPTATEAPPIATITAASILLPLPIHPESKDVHCGEPMSSPIEHTYLWDQIVPGQSTKEEVLVLLGEPYEIIESGDEDWWLYRSGAIIFNGMNDLVIGRDDPRHKLGEIVAKYGLPIQVIWQLPTFTGPHAVPRTYLLYPHQGVYFVSQDKLTVFTSDTFFLLNHVVEPSRFEEALRENGLFYERATLFAIEWPCSVGND